MEIEQKKMILYALGSFGSFLLYFMFTTYILYFYVDLLFLPVTLFNLGFVILVSLMQLMIRYLVIFLIELKQDMVEEDRTSYIWLYLQLLCGSLYGFQ
ncbi:MAG: hypothetical protein ACFE8U_04920 [Candidatus Hermodarchaeota archaeon]